MLVLQGIPASPGVAIGEALVIGNEDFRIPQHFVLDDAVDQEIARLDQAMDLVEAEMTRDRNTVTDELGEQYGAIFSAHVAMLRDPKLREELEGLIRDQHYSSEYAVSCTLRRYAKVFQQLQSPYLAERSHDLFDLEKSLLRSLGSRCHEQLSQLTSPAVVLARNLTPSETAKLNREFALGFVTEAGGASSHTAIVAKGLEIPAVVGVGPFLADVSGGDCVIVDGDQGKVIIRPDKKILADYLREREVHRTHALQLREIRDLPAETADGVRVQLVANIEFPLEVESCLARGAEGVGLYRTEFLHLGVATEPSEDDHYQAYWHVARAMGDLPVVIRTLDLGADKLGLLPKQEEEDNPFLGLRSIRLSLRNVRSFRIQLRAILRASVQRNLRVMFPMIGTLNELRKAKLVLADAMEDLEEEGVDYDREIPVGMMVETPAAAIMVDKFAREVDFISIGTNDLTQYTLAVDRGNRDVADLYRSADPAVLRLIDHCVRTAREAGITVSVCGEMSGSPGYAILLMGFGVRSLSVAPGSIPEIKRIIRSVTLDQCQAIARRVLTMDSADEVDAYLREEIKSKAPELLLGQQVAPAG